MMSDMLTVGVDPDLHSTAIVFARDGKPEWIGVTKADLRKYKGIDAVDEVIKELSSFNWPVATVEAIAIEGQQVYGKDKSDVDPKDLLRLALVSGAVFAMCRSLYPAAGIAVPEPKNWKGQAPKEVKQARILHEADIPFKVVNGKVITDFPQGVITPNIIPVSKLTHAIDALGLAQWAMTIEAARYFSGRPLLRPSRLRKGASSQALSGTGS